MSTFQYACEKCGNHVAITRAEFNQRRNVVRCPDCLTPTAEQKPRSFKDAVPPSRRPICDNCQATSGVASVYRLDPVNWHERLSMRCAKPACRHGWTVKR